MKRIVLGILAHVDAGKTTLSEALLYKTGAIRTLGRVDHRDAHLDTHALERARGITIFSKQAQFQTGDTAVALLDTPGHVDFSAEMERTLQILDYAILVISATDGVQAHTQTLWKLLSRYQIPTLIFITKMDLPNPGRDVLMHQLQQQLSAGCVDMGRADCLEEIALQDEALMEQFLEAGGLEDSALAAQIRCRELFPCYFGSALKQQGVDALLDAIRRYLPMPSYPESFAANVYKILRDAQNNRLTLMKITGGQLPVRTLLRYQAPDGMMLEEKVTQIRRYSGDKFETLSQAEAGTVCAVLGLSATAAGQGLGAAAGAAAPLLQPAMTYRLLLPAGCSSARALPKLRQLEEEDPQLHLSWNQERGEIQLQLMGEIQIEVLKSLIHTRFDLDVEIGEGQILYRETISAPVEGVGHFEPLRHYAEVHLILTPLPRGSGLQFDSICSENVLDRNWQRLILTHLAEKPHLGVLTGSPITDLKITLAAGRAHLKHTEGGDFRQATYRAVRQGLMQAKSILLEPVYTFRLEVPLAQLGRAIQDLQARHGTFSAPEQTPETAILRGSAPVAALRGYPAEVAAYTKGRGSFSCYVSGYAPCHNAVQVIAQCGYDPQADLANTPDSVFCSHGAGFTVKWDQVPQYMHLERCLREKQAPLPEPKLRTANLQLDDKELEAILLREFGPISRRQYTKLPTRTTAPAAPAAAPPRRQLLIVDGYNVIFAWNALKALAQVDLDRARIQLMDLLSNYAAYTGVEVILVFDAYRVKDGRGSREDYHNIHVVYTKEQETGDLYIERLTHEIGRNCAVRVVTSDQLIQLSALRAGVLRISARAFEEELEQVGKKIALAAEKGTT